MKRMRALAGIAAIAGVLTALAAPLNAADVVSEWANAKAPPVPELKPVTVKAGTTALLLLDFMKENCGARPRCVATIPNVKRLHDAARAAGAMVFYTMTGEHPIPVEMLDKSFPPRDGEWVAQPGPDKFLGSGLDERLKARGITTVIVCGTSYQGVGIGTGSASAQRGYNVVIPVDCLSSEDLYREQYATWHMAKGGPALVTSKTTVTRSGMINFER